MEEAKSCGLFKKYWDEETIAEIWYNVLSELPKFKEIYAKLEPVSEEAEIEAVIKAELKNYKWSDMFNDIMYISTPGSEVCLLPGSVSFRFGDERLSVIARGQVPLDCYYGTMFVFRDKVRSGLIELRIGYKGVLMKMLHKRHLCGTFVDQGWPDAETEVKFLPMADYKAMFDRMLSRKKGQ